MTEMIETRTLLTLWIPPFLRIFLRWFVLTSRAMSDPLQVDRSMGLDDRLLKQSALDDDDCRMHDSHREKTLHFASFSDCIIANRHGTLLESTSWGYKAQENHSVHLRATCWSQSKRISCEKRGETSFCSETCRISAFPVQPQGKAQFWQTRPSE